MVRQWCFAAVLVSGARRLQNSGRQGRRSPPRHVEGAGAVRTGRQRRCFARGACAGAARHRCPQSRRVWRCRTPGGQCACRGARSPARAGRAACRAARCAAPARRVMRCVFLCRAALRVAMSAVPSSSWQGGSRRKVRVNGAKAGAEWHRCGGSVARARRVVV